MFEEKRYREIINYFATSLLGSNSVAEILWDITYNCISKMDFEDCVIYLFNEDRTKLVQAAAYGSGKESNYQILNPIEILPGKGIVGTVALNGEAEIVADVTLDPRYIVDDLARGSEITVPIIYENQVIGIIDSEHSEKEFFTNQHLEILQFISSLCANKIIRVQSQEANRASQEKYSNLFEYSNDGILLFNSAGVVLDANLKALKLFGYRKAEILATPLRHLYAPEAKEADTFFLSQISQTGNIKFELGLCHRDGSVFDAEISACMIEIGAEKVFQAIIRDITERKRIENVLRESEARKTAIMESALDCIITIDITGKVLEFNAAAEATFGYKREAVVGRPLDETIIPYFYREGHRAGMARHRKTGQSSILGKRFEITALRADGHEFPIEIMITPIDEAKGRIFTACLRDISDRKKAEETLIEGKRKAEEASRMKTEFLDVMSHELRTPLTVMLGNLPLLTDKTDLPDADEIAEIARDIEESGKHLLTLVNDLLDISKIEAGKLELRHQHISAKDFILSTVKPLEAVAKEKGLYIRADVVDVDIEVDLTRFKQILLNLLSNAVKFTNEGGVTISLYPQDDWVYLEVKDTGCGIKREDLGAIFDVFRQLDYPSSRKSSGSGLGLAITKKLVELHQGNITVETEPGMGSVFTVKIPYHSQQEN